MAVRATVANDVTNAGAWLEADRIGRQTVLTARIGRDKALARVKARLIAIRSATAAA
jgi:hypothetical protein